LTLITFTIRSLERHRENHHFSLISLTTITFKFNKLSCYGGSYYANIAVVSYQSKAFEFVRPSMPMSPQQFLQSSLTHFRVRSPFRMVICRYQPPLRALHLSTSTNIISYRLTFWLHDMSMGHACLVCKHILFFSLEKGLGPTIFPLPMAYRSYSSSLHSSLQWNSHQNKHLCISAIHMLLTSHIRGHLSPLKYRLQHFTQMVK
jgi:hypothetical protein